MNRALEAVVERARRPWRGNIGARCRFVEAYAFPPLLARKLRERHPALSDGDVNLVLDGLRGWLLACVIADGRRLEMPSRLVDDAWHEFILMTPAYVEFCEKAYRRYLHHTPDGLEPRREQAALRRTAELAFRVDPRAAAGVPLLFAIDGRLGVDGATIWSRNDFERLRNGRKDGPSSGGGCCGSGGHDGRGGSCSASSCSGGGGCGGGGGGS